MTMNDKKEFNVKELAELLKVDTKMIYNYIKLGHLTGIPKTEPAKDDYFGQNVDWTFTLKDIELLEKSLRKHAREKVLSETGRHNEIYGETSDFVKSLLESRKK